MQVWVFFLNVFEPGLVKSIDAEPTDSDRGPTIIGTVPSPYLISLFYSRLPVHH
jgi:hypothetical protein